MSCPLKKYSNIFGEPNTGFHSARLLDIAIYDLLGTIAISGVISYFLKYNFFLVLIIIMIIAILLHRIFCVNTTINKLIFGTLN
jgi:hypothetical protein